MKNGKKHCFPSKYFKFFLLIIFSLYANSCAMIFNKKDVEISFKSYPEGAKVFIDGEEVGKTPLNTQITPDKSYQILYVKDGFSNREFKIHNTTADSRLRPRQEHLNCMLDWAGFLFVVPIISASSYKCSNFDDSVYFKALDKGNRVNVINQNAD